MPKTIPDTKNKIILYTDKRGNVELRADVEKETIWATLDQIAELLGRDKSVISRHLKNIFAAKELDKSAVVASRPYQSMGIGMAVTRDIYLYPNVQFLPLDMRSDLTNVGMSANISFF